jgi:hypothetical protein
MDEQLNHLQIIKSSNHQIEILLAERAAHIASS